VHVAPKQSALLEHSVTHSLAVVATLNSPVTQTPPPPAPALGTHESDPAQSAVV